MIQRKPGAINKIHHLLLNKRPRMDFLVKIAHPYEKEHIMKIMLGEHRQTMNLRVMPTAKLVLLQDPYYNNKIVGWMGFDYQHNPQFPETFSLFLTPNYRGIHLSLILKHAVYSILDFRGITKSYIRMEASHNQRLIDHNTDSGFYRILSPSEINPEWQSMCFQCELYQKKCVSQAYLEVDITKLITSLNNKFGKLLDMYFPKSISLKPQFIKGKKEIHTYFPAWNLYSGESNV